MRRNVMRMTPWFGLLASVLVVVPASGSTAAASASPSPDPAAQAHILFGRKAADAEEFDIIVTNLDGSDERTLIPGPHDVARVSHDGTRIATVSFGETLFPTIYRADGSDPVDLHPEPTLNLGAMAWSRDDQWLAFEAWDDTGKLPGGVYLLRPDGTDLHLLSANGGVPGDFSPDDRQVVLWREDGLYVIDVDGTHDRRVGTIVPELYPGYMPDGRSLYASADGQLQIVDLDTGAATPIEVTGGHAVEPRLSPDGSRFVYAFDATDADSIGVWWMNVDGSDPTEIVNTPGTEEVFPDWLP
jgi:Tol biopolymer transport system component